MERAQNLALSELARDEQAVHVGQRLFIDNCAACHGNNAQGIQAIGAPDLLDTASLYGNSNEMILQSISDGRTSVIQAWQRLGYGKIKNLAHYVRSLSGEAHDAEAAKVSEKHFANCAACHGADGKGNQALGAPDLTDKVSSYGNSVEQLSETITHGRTGVMPAWKNRLGEVEIWLITVWIRANDKTKQHHNSQDSGLRWYQRYQVPVLWLSAGILGLTLMACAHLIFLSTEKAAVLPSENHSSNIILLTTSAKEHPVSGPETSDDNPR